jgi:hypothetical protein
VQDNVEAEQLREAIERQKKSNNRKRGYPW